MASKLLHEHEVLYLSRRNLQTLINKLDRRKAGGDTQGSIVKYDDKHPTYAATMPACIVVAVEDEEYYTDRHPGPSHDAP